MWNDYLVLRISMVKVIDNVTRRFSISLVLDLEFMSRYKMFITIKMYYTTTEPNLGFKNINNDNNTIAANIFKLFTKLYLARQWRHSFSQGCRRGRV